MEQNRLALFQECLAKNEQEWESVRCEMDRRERLYRGERRLKPLTKLDTDRGGIRETPHIRNIVAEIIEAQVNASIPQPKVTPRCKEDEPLAKIIEDMLRDELTRLPMERLNDLQERTVPIQGGSFFLCEWDNTMETHKTVGEITITSRHPKQVVPQAGVYTGIEDMDYFFLKLPQTKAYIQRRYGVTVEEERETEPSVRAGDEETVSDDLVTQITCYYKNGKGGIGRFSWVGNTVLEDLEDYEARQMRRCKACDTMEPLGGGACPQCGGTEFRLVPEEYEELSRDIHTALGTHIPAMTLKRQETGEYQWEKTKIPFYRPNAYPLILQRNVTVFGQLLGDSDVDKIADQQNTINRMELKLVDRIIKSGTRITLPDRADIRLDPEDGEKILIGNVQDKSLIGVYQFEGDVSPIMAYMAQVYEEARQCIGITDSFQGRQDSSASSGVAKQFAAAQSAGRLESKRIMKDAAYADLFKLMFQLRLAYADEPRPIVARDGDGNTVYEEFCRYDFLKQDEDGSYYWNDQFLFSTDTSAPLANNRERMWQETLQLFQAGTFGNPTEPDTLVALWTKLELLHYPGAKDTKAFMERKREKEQTTTTNKGVSNHEEQREVL